MREYTFSINNNGIAVRDGSEGKSVSDYTFLNWETHDDGTIVRISLNRPDQRNAQNRGMLVELDEAF